MYQFSHIHTDHCTVAFLINDSSLPLSNTYCMHVTCMQCCQVYECIRTLRIYGVQREPEIDGGLLHNPRILLKNILLLNVHARVSEGTAGISDSELESLLGEPLLPREVSPGILQAVGLSNPLAPSFLCRRFVARIFPVLKVD